MRTERTTSLEGCVPFCDKFDAIISTKTESDGKEQVFKINTSCKHIRSCEARKSHMEGK